MTSEIRTVLVTGSNSFIGSRLVKVLESDFNVISFARSANDGVQPTILGSFTSLEDLSQLDELTIDACVHLGAAVSGSEDNYLTVNVCGTRTLVRYLVDRGCRRFVFASSIAAVGCLNPAFLPHELPISDDYPCEAIDAYGLSKSLMEEVVRYFHRTVPGLDLTLFRIGLVLPDTTPPIDQHRFAEFRLPFTHLGCIAVDDVLTALALGVSHDLPADIRRVNLVAPMARTPIPTAEAIEHLLGSKASALNLSYFRQSQNASAGVFSTGRLSELFNFVPEVDVRTMTKGSGIPHATEARQ